MYRCLNCGKEIDIKQVNEKIRCPYCGYKIILKENTNTVTTVSSD